ncbi:unnamed protein product [Sphenostylis stenocarpa]|uniref:25S rRNA (uridine-N(3))-methyltransferase BMT5-like domain-containing protein n=1 Tax=Sphenostylis stenocarpa TaxID=92480 RepID=A0AA86SRW9_9FABA|nr:unnamed protein product [Sphenostylis stenocarpa]
MAFHIGTRTFGGSSVLKSAQNLAELTKLGCTVVHEVDAQTMSEHPLLKPMCFDRIVFNFPHAGFVYQENDIRQIELHKDVVSGFLKSARNMVSDDGEIHVTHKNSHPYNLWEIVKLAEKVNLQLVEKVPFYAYHYLGYVNKRGSGVRCDQSFPVGDCSTFKFAKASVVDLLGL